MAGGLVTRNITITSQGANGQTLTGSSPLLGNEEVNFEQTVPGSSTNQNYVVVFPHATLQSFDISVSNTATGNTTIKFNSSGSPIATFILAPGQLWHWDADEAAANATSSPNPLSADSTGIYVTTGITSCVVNISALVTV